MAAGVEPTNFDPLVSPDGAVDFGDRQAAFKDGLFFIRAEGEFGAGGNDLRVDKDLHLGLFAGKVGSKDAPVGAHLGGGQADTGWVFLFD